MTATFCGPAPGSRAGRVNSDGVEMKTTKPSAIAETVATVAESVRIIRKNSADCATPENRNRLICRFSFRASTMPMIVPGMPVSAIISEMNCESTVKPGLSGKRYSITVYSTSRPVIVKRNW